MCEKFLIHVHFTELTILNVSEDLEHKEISLNIELDDAKIESKVDKILAFKNGPQEIDSNFTLQSEDLIDNEEFIFQSLAKGLRVNLSTEIMITTQRPKKQKTSSTFKNEVFARGKIEVLKLFRQEKLKSFIMLDTVENNMEIALNFKVQFENSPQISSVLSMEIENFYNFKVSNESTIEACIRFPFKENFRAAMMEESKSFQPFSSQHLVDDKLNLSEFQIDSSTPYKVELLYENYQDEIGLKFFERLIECRQNLLIEFRVDEKMMMSFIELDVFNYPGVNDVIFISPLYEWNKNLILELFKQEACLKDKKLASKKETRVSTRKKLSEFEESNSLVPVKIDGKHAAISLRIKFSNPLKPVELIENLKLQLIEKFKLVSNESSFEKAQRKSDEDFKSAIEDIANDFESFLKKSPNVSEFELKKKIESFYDENNLKESVKALIGNFYNIEKNTTTNHEFKLLMIDVYKSLNSRIQKILNDKWIKGEKFQEIQSNPLRKIQIEEWMVMKDDKKAQEIIDMELKNFDKDIRKLEELAFYEFKMGNSFECEMTIMKILKIDQLNVFGLYFLSYIVYDRSEICAAILLMKILLKIFPQSLEILTLLKSFYEDINFSAGVKFCKIHLKNGQFIPLYGHHESLLYPEMIDGNLSVKILHQQLNFKFEKFIKIIKTSMNEESFELKIFDTIKALEEENYDESSNILKSLEMNDDSEIILRILKGNLLFSTRSQWRAICEYEIAYNLCLKENLKCPHMLALRCGQWYLNDMKNYAKARRYFHHCCRNLGTFNSWNGLGVVSLFEMGYKNAEKYFNVANQIYQNCADNWTYLAFVNIKLNRINIALECYLTAKSLGAQESEIIYEIERELKI